MDNNYTETPENIWGRTYFLIIGIALMGMMGGSLLGPVLSALTEPFGIADNQVGMVLAVYTASTAFFMPFIGILIDKFGSKRIVVPCLFINGFAGSLVVIAPNFTVVLVLRAIQGIGIAGLMPVAMTLIGNFFKGPRMVQAMGSLSSILAMGGVMAPMVGGGLAMISWQCTFLFYSLSLPLAVAIMLWLPRLGIRRDTSITKVILNYGNIVKNRAFITLASIHFIMAFLMLSVVTFVPLYLSRSLGMSEGMTGLILAIQGLAAAVAGLLIRYLKERFGIKRLMFTGFLVCGLAYYFISSATTIPVIVMSLYILGTGFGLIMPLSNTMITQVVPKETMGAATSLYSTMNFAGQAASPILLGVVFGAFGLKAVFWVAGFIAVAGAAGILFTASTFLMVKEKHEPQT